MKTESCSRLRTLREVREILLLECHQIAFPELGFVVRPEEMDRPQHVVEFATFI